MTATATPLLVARPASDFEPRALLHVVRQVAEAAEAETPVLISTRAWDLARPRCQQFADAPAARRISEHLGLPWPKLCELAFMPPAGQRIALGKALNEKQGNWLTPEYCDFILRLVADRLEVTSLNPGQYWVEASDMLAANRQRWMHGGHLRLPRPEQIEVLAGSWNRALAHAGLRARGNGFRPRLQLATVVEVLECCFEVYGEEPTSAELRAFAGANHIPVTTEKGRKWATFVAEWKAERVERGLPVPDGPPPLDQRWDYTQDVGATIPDRWRRRPWFDFDELVQWVMRYLSELPAGTQPSLRSYSGWVSRQTDAPWPSSFERHGGWTFTYEAARDRLVTGPPPAARDAKREVELRRREVPRREVRPKVVRQPVSRPRVARAKPQRQPSTRRPPVRRTPEEQRAHNAAEQRRRRAEARRRIPPSERRGRGRKSTTSLAELVAAGRLAGDERLIGTRHDRRWAATFNHDSGAVDVEGEGHFVSLTAAAVHCLGGGTANGWEFWGVERNGQLVRLAKLRA